MQELKLAEQRRFVLWWDAQEKQAGARGSGSNQYHKVASPVCDATTLLLADHHLDRSTVSRWRTRLTDPKSTERERRGD